MRKSCSLSHQRYKDDLEKNKEAVESDLILKWKAKDEEIQKVKQKISGLKVALNHLVKRFSSKLYWLMRNKT